MNDPNHHIRTCLVMAGIGPGEVGAGSITMVPFTLCLLVSIAIYGYALPAAGLCCHLLPELYEILHVLRAG
jgi:hypothetical protein